VVAQFERVVIGIEPVQPQRFRQADAPPARGFYPARPCTPGAIRGTGGRSVCGGGPDAFQSPKYFSTAALAFSGVTLPITTIVVRVRPEGVLVILFHVLQLSDFTVSGVPRAAPDRLSDTARASSARDTSNNRGSAAAPRPRRRLLLHHFERIFRQRRMELVVSQQLQAAIEMIGQHVERKAAPADSSAPISSSAF
jgi:hypothetical protein